MLGVFQDNPGTNEKTNNMKTSNMRPTEECYTQKAFVKNQRSAEDKLEKVKALQNIYLSSSFSFENKAFVGLAPAIQLWVMFFRLIKALLLSVGECC